MMFNSSKFRIRRIKFIVYILLVISLCIFLLSIWFSSETRQTRVQISSLKKEENALESEISLLRVQATRLHSPENVSKIAEKLDMVRTEKPPIVLKAE